MEPKNRFQGTHSGRLYSLAGRYNSPIPTRFLAPLDCLKIPAQATWLAGRYENSTPELTLSPIYSFPYSLVVQVLLFGIIHFFPIFLSCSGPSLHFFRCSGSSLRHYPLLSYILLLFRPSFRHYLLFLLFRTFSSALSFFFPIFSCCSGFFSSALSTSFPYSFIVQDLIFGIILFFPIFSCCLGPSLRHYPLLSHSLLLFRTFSAALATSFPYSLVVQDLPFGIIHFFPIFSNCSGPSLRHYPLLSHILLLFRTFSSALSTSFPYSLIVQDLLFGIILFFPIFSCCSGPSLRH
jgi:hypothetical protein